MSEARDSFNPSTCAGSAGLAAPVDTEASGASAQDLSAHLGEGMHSRGFRLSALDPTRTTGWDSMVGGFTETEFFHGSAWAAVLRESCGFAPFYLTLRLEEQPVGLLPLMEVRTALTPRRAVCLPFTDVCAPVAADTGYHDLLVSAALRVGVTRGWRSVEVRGDGGNDNAVPEQSVAFWWHRIDLPTEPEAAFAQVRPEARRAVRKAIANGVKVSFEQSVAGVREFYSLYVATRRKHGLPPQSFRFFEAIQRNVLENQLGVVVLARWRDRPVAGAVFFRQGEKGVFKYGASDPGLLWLRANNLVMWQGIAWCVEQGVRSLHLGRTSLNNNGLRRFKLGWGAQEGRIRYLKRLCRTGKILNVPDRALGLHNSFFRILPLPVLRGIGAVAYRHMA